MPEPGPLPFPLTHAADDEHFPTRVVRCGAAHFQPWWSEVAVLNPLMVRGSPPRR
jgi:hypothetical protein